MARKQGTEARRIASSETRAPGAVKGTVPAQHLESTPPSSVGHRQATRSAAGELLNLVEELAGIVVCGHIGLTPQSSGQLGGHKAQGRTFDSAQAVVEDARAVYNAGAQLLLIEAVPPEVAGFIRDELPIPVIGLGAGTEVDGQLLIVSDVLGIFQAFTPKFVKKYADIAGVSTTALTQYVTDVRAGAFPADEHCYHMLAGETEKFEEWGRQNRHGA